MKKEFSITFWVSVEKNPSWIEKDSEITFPPFSVNNWIQVYVSKIWKTLKVFILHPELWYRKITANIEEYLTEKTFIALTHTKLETKLYFNAKLASVIDNKKLNSNLEVWDYVMVKIKNWDLNTLMVTGKAEVIWQAKIEKIQWDKLTLNFFGQWEVKTFLKNKLIF